jgi:hypothetical protein
MLFLLLGEASTFGAFIGWYFSVCWTPGYAQVFGENAITM